MLTAIFRKVLVKPIKSPWRIFRRLTRRAVLQLLDDDKGFQNSVTSLKVQVKAPVKSQVKDAKTDDAQTSSGQVPERRFEELLVARSELIAASERNEAQRSQQMSSAWRDNLSFSESEEIVTIIVTLFNENVYVQHAIESLKHQTYKKFNAIIVDDASTNGARAAALKAIDNDPRFRIVQHLKNGGVNAARNTGLRLADTPFVIFLDADDILLRDTIERRLGRFLETFDDCVAGVFDGVVPGPEDLTASYVPSNLSWSGRIHTFISVRGHCPFPIHSPLLRTDILRQLGGFDESMRAGAEDWEMWQRVLRHGYIFIPVEMKGGVYRTRPGSRVRRSPHEHTELGWNIVQAAHRELPAGEIYTGSPYVFRKAIHHYQQQADFLHRFLIFASMAYMSGAEKFAWFCDNLPFEVWNYQQYEFDFKTESKSGLIRFLSLDDDLAKTLDPLLDEVAEKIVSELAAHVRDRLSAQFLNQPDARDPSAALFANGVAQAKAMAKIAKELTDRGVAAVLVSVEMLTGDQGVEDYWSAVGVEYISYNTYLLRQEALASKVNIVMRPYSAAVRNLLGNVPTIEVENPYGETSLPEANGPFEPDYVCARDDAASLAEEILSGVEGVGARTPAFKAFGSAGIIVDLEERADGASEREKIQRLRGKHAGERCFILGNGPSLNDVNFTKLVGERVFAANGFFLKQRENGFVPNFYIVSDATVMRENSHEIEQVEADYKIFSSLSQGLQPDCENTIYYLLNRGYYEPKGEHFCVPRFSMDPSARLFCGQSVTLTSLQLAYYMGFTNVYLLGMDFHYEVPAADVVNGELIKSAGFDPNHFSSSYVSAGMTWKVPHLDRVKMGYEFARDVFESTGRKIYNATSGGELEVFERLAFEEALADPNQRILAES